VILGASAIENDFVDLLSQEAFRDRFSYLFSRGAICRRLTFAGQSLLHRPRGRQSFAGIVIDNLRVDMSTGKINR
jgi:hypothetical protein